MSFRDKRLQEKLRNAERKWKRKTDEKKIKVFCSYCANPAKWVPNKEIYGKNYGRSYMIWLCKPCDAYVGCHNNTKKPLGEIANKETRHWRKEAHKAFDPLWKESALTREEAYHEMREHFGGIVHIGESDVEKCKKIVSFCNLYRQMKPSIRG